MEHETSLTAMFLVAGHRAARLLESHLPEAKLSAGEAMLLNLLRRGPLTMTGVMSVLHIKPSTATSLVNRLERAGLVVRSANPEDGRSLLVRLTADGVAMAATAKKAFAAMDKRLVESTEPSALETFARLLDALGEQDPSGHAR